MWNVTHLTIWDVLLGRYTFPCLNIRVGDFLDPHIGTISGVQNEGRGSLSIIQGNGVRVFIHINAMRSVHITLILRLLRDNVESLTGTQRAR
jgi:hypothetical protein